MKKTILVIGVSIIFGALILMQTSMVYAAPVYILDYASFPAYPYNTVPYMVGGAYVGCGPTTGAMIFGYFQHHFGLTTLLVPPIPVGTDEGLNTAWALHGAAYMNTQPNGFGSIIYIKPGLEDLAEDRGHEVEVMAHVSTSTDPTDPYYLTNYGAYGDGWTNDADFWVDLGGDVWDIDPNLFCDFVGTKLSSGICIFLTVDSDGDGGGDHWIPCVGYDKEAGMYFYYNTYDSILHSAIINGVGAPGPAVYAISFVRTVEYIQPPPPTAASIESSDVGGNKIDQFGPSDTVYVYGSDYDADHEYDIYVVADSTWIDGMSIPTRIAGTAITVTSDASGNIPVGTQVWSSPLTPGKYDIVVDVNGNGQYDADTDALDDSDIEVTAGFFVIPDVPLGTLMAFAAMIIGFVCYYSIPKVNKKKVNIDP